VTERIEMLKDSDSLEASMVLCSCGMGFFGFDRVSKLHRHLSDNPSHNSQKYKDQRITGKQWFATYVNQKQHLEEWLSNHGTIEQQSLFQNVLNCKHTCSVGKAGTGKTFMMRKVDDFLSMIFLNPGEIVRIAPLGRVAQFFHCEARTVHSTMRLHMDTRDWTDNDFVSYLESIDSQVFSKMKVLIGLEMFVMCDCVLSGLLMYIRKCHPKTLLLCEGDPIQLSVGQGNPVLCDPKFDDMFDTVVFDTQQRITNSEQKTALDKMRLREADDSVLSYWSSRVREKPDINCFTIYALKDKAEQHNEVMLQHHERRYNTQRIQKIASDQCKGREVSFPGHVERNCIVDKVLSILPHAPVFFTRNINAMALCNSKEIYVGNGTPATVTSVEPSFIVVKLESGAEVMVEPIPIDIEGSEGYTRTQYPLILGWASTIHKVQGMQFAKVQIHFCFKGSNIQREAASYFYRGMAYMAFSRSEHIIILGQICLELLNNVNPYALQYWQRKNQQWSNRNSKDTKLVYRDAIHAQNNFCAQSFRDIRQLSQKNKRRESTTPLALNVSAAVPASTSARIAEVAALAPASASAPAHVPATASASAYVAASCASASDQVYPHSEEYDSADINIDDDYTDSAETTTVHAKPAPAPSLAIAVSASKPALADAHDPAQHTVVIRANNSDSVSQAWKPQNCDDRIRLVAPPLASALAPAPDDGHAQRPVHANQSTSTTLSERLATQRCNIVIGPSHNDSSSKAKKRQTCESRLSCVSKLWNETFKEVFPRLGKTTWEEGIKFREGSRGYGTATSDCCVLMLDVLKDLYPKEFLGKTLPCFVDIGSGIGNIILQMSALQPDFKCCLGIELETNRAAFAVEACRVFAEKASKNNIQFCQIEAHEGNCFDDANCKQALMSASLVWINNEIFQPGDNLKLLNHLHSLVPVNCIIMSFVELLVTKRSSETTPQSDEPTDFLVHPPRQLQNASSWTQHKPNFFKKVFIIQRQTGKFLSAKNDDVFVSR
jgi:hypothetical protein